LLSWIVSVTKLIKHDFTSDYLIVSPFEIPSMLRPILSS
jgi:hypothetical protein